MRNRLVYIILLAVLLLPLSSVRAFVIDSTPNESPASTPFAPNEDGSTVVIVIDPGHGGDDSGAVGPGGVREKDITLSVAAKLAERLRERLGCRVLLTRTDDTFIPLQERTAIANRARADIFISIHANAATSKEAKGVETFFLSLDATDDDARKVAEFENSILSYDFKINGQDSEDLKDILWDLAVTESNHESSALAESVHTSMLGATGKENRGVKQAPFVVLSGAAMPAILVEVGFISNPREEKWLSRGEDQEKIADSITEGVAAFKHLSGTRKDYLGFNETSEKKGWQGLR